MKISEVLRILFISGSLTGFLPCTSAATKYSESRSISDIYTTQNQANLSKSETTNLEKENNRLGKILNSFIKGSLSSNDILDYQLLVDSIVTNASKAETDSLVMSESYYYAGIYYSITKNPKRALEFLKLSFEIRNLKGVNDIRTARILYNISVAYSQLGDLFRMADYSILSISLFSKILGESSFELIDPYTALVSAYIDLQETAKAVDISNKALMIIEKDPEKVSSQSLSDIYSNLGVCYSRMADFSKAKLYLEKAETIMESENLFSGENYINLTNSLAIVYGHIGLKDRSVEYYKKGVSLAMNFTPGTSSSLNIINSYAYNLADSGKYEQAEDLFSLLIKKAGKSIKENPQLFYTVLNNYADFLREYTKNYQKSLDLNAKCMEFVKEHPDNYNLRIEAYVGYSLSLSKNGDNVNAIKYIQDLISEVFTVKETMVFANPALNDIKPNKTSLEIFEAKYQVLWDIWSKSKDNEALKATAATSELVIALLEKIRINISEEASRFLLGDKYRELYFNAITSFNLLYIITSDNEYLNKAFEYAEKSKVAGLLSSTRELKASQFQIPADLANLEFRLKGNLSALNEMISGNANKENPDKEFLQGLNDKVLRTTRARDSLISVFEKEFPGYYAIKYNTRVALIENIPEIVGRNGNYINYIMSDSILFIFVANRKFTHLTSVNIDTVFYNQIKQFRKLLSMPGSSEDASAAFLKYQTSGYELYKKLIEPIRKFLISEKIFISPDNILSYIPFETLPTDAEKMTGLQYRSLHYLMEDFDISYTYSATFMAESESSNINFKNKSISFAPNYPDPIDINTLLMSRQEENGILSDLPHARLEAEYVSEITNGLLFENAKALESVFKKEAKKFDIIHLAMHTLMNDKDPMRSTLIFSPESDTLNDGYLKTFEVYGLPLKAKMVVLSSCNTGNGFLSTGEGILSLARGFIYSGSKSVVMSMWEIEDRSGTEIVKMFYRNLKRGYSKSESLRRARISYLKNSDQLRSHPYFWSSLVVYGNNNPLYFSRYLIAGLTAIGVILSVLITLYFRKRRYS